MDANNSGQAPATDDQELAKVLAGMNQQVETTDTTATTPAAEPAADPAAAPIADPMQYEAATLPTPAADPAPAADLSAPSVLSPLDPSAVTTMAPADAPQLSPELENLKKDALEQLRPLIDKLDLPAEEKFDTLLLIIRSTDDQSLLAAANEAAKKIEDETKRAQALLDVIKEIDFFGSQGK